MEKTITLTEAQLSMLQEYKHAESLRLMFHGRMTAAAAKADSVIKNIVAYEIEYRNYINSCAHLDSAARVFASSIAAVV
jgi:hypothetical protein